MDTTRRLRRVTLDGQQDSNVLFYGCRRWSLLHRDNHLLLSNRTQSHRTRLNDAQTFP